MGLVNLRALKRQIEELANRCRCTKIKVVNVVGVVPDTEQQNTIQVLTNNEIWFVACDGEVVLLGLTEGVMTCTDVLACIGIDAIGGDAGMFLNEQGNFVAIDLTQPTSPITANFSGGGSALTDTQTLGVDMIDVPVPYGFTLVGYTLISESAGDLQVSIQETDYTDYTASFTDITGGNFAYIVGDIKNQDTTLTGWTTSFAANKVFRFTLVEVNGQIWASVVLHIVKT